MATHNLFRLVRERNTIPVPRKSKRNGAARAMTIAAGFRCADGVILCSDTQISTDLTKSYEAKISKIRLAHGTVIVAYAGLRDTMRIVVKRLKKELEGQEVTGKEIQDRVQAALNGIVPSKPKSSGDIYQMLFGAHDGHDISLLKSVNRDISPVPLWDCIGIAQDAPLIPYLIDLLFKAWQKPLIEQMVPFCNYLVLKAKDYIQDCGGRTDVVALTSEGKVYRQTASYARTIESQLREVEIHLAHAISTIFDGHTTRGKNELSVRLFQNSLELLPSSIEATMEDDSSHTRMERK